MAHRRALRFFGGASFSPGRDGAGACWGDFGDASFILPRFLYVDGPEGAYFLCTTEAARAQEDADTTFELLSAQSTVRAGKNSTPYAISRAESEAPDTWREMIDSIQREIGAGAVEKVVAARRITLQLSEKPILSDVIERMNASAAHCARFALRIGSRTFVGATPERLIERRGDAIHTEALAGSIRREQPDSARTLVESRKDQQEHALVVSEVRAALAPICSEIIIPTEPEIRSLKHLLHLRTPVSGKLRGDEHILSLVERLHPTPAVGGVPRARAVALIQAHERAERGWYAAPLGWVNADGDGEFVVALRSGLICGDKVHLYAGAGIGPDSSALGEFDETEVKLAAMFGALGLAS